MNDANYTHSIITLLLFLFRNEVKMYEMKFSSFRLLFLLGKDNKLRDESKEHDHFLRA